MLHQVGAVRRQRLGHILGRAGVPAVVFVDRVVPLLPPPVLAGKMQPAEPVVGGGGKLGDLFKAAVEEHLGPHALHLEAKAQLDEIAAKHVADRLIHRHPVRDPEDLFARLKVRKVRFRFHHGFSPCRLAGLTPGSRRPRSAPGDGGIPRCWEGSGACTPRKSPRRGQWTPRCRRRRSSRIPPRTCW